ncbi:MAG TPA: hypothetical protein VHC23_14435, partial [Jatrophihabitans sp.]|nr:hypothetical protein [Jatrophihabitans sp.]
LFALGAPAWLVAAAAGATGALEYVRARAVATVGGAGGRITPGERPTRLLLAALGALAAGIAPGHAGAAATAAAAATFGLVTLSCCWLLVDLRARLEPGR